MTDRPILFSAPMVRALLEGRKTQTRRVLKPQPRVQPELHEPTEGAPYWCVFSGDEIAHKVPVPYVPGDRLWVRETCATWGKDVSPARVEVPVVYRADETDEEWSNIRHDAAQGAWKLRPSIHMPRWASRLTLTVADVRVQRLQEMSEDDAWAEGCVKGDPDDVGGYFPAEEPDPSGKGYRGWDNARDWFADLWDSLNADRAPWDSNPRVCALTFTVHQTNIDKLEAA